MLIQIEGPNQHFNAYYKDNSLLIQFIIAEFVQTYQLTNQLKALIQKHLNSLPTTDSAFPSLFQVLGQLVGGLSPYECLSLSISSWQKGSLTKLKEYCEQFLRNSQDANKQFIYFHTAVHRAWLSALQNLEFLNSLQPTYAQAQKSTFFHLSFKRSFETLQIHFNQVVQRLPRLIQAYWNHENIVLCLLRKKIHLTEIYGPDFWVACFKWPLSSDQLSHSLTQYYQKRGYEALVSMIQQLLSPHEVYSHDYH